jgi:tripartite-type tricarboxylate transporter receptor subunit TctC
MRGQPVRRAAVTRRRLSCLALGAAAWPGRAALGQAFPARPIRLIVPYPPGGSTDFLARIFAMKLAERLGQPVVVENRGGGGTLVGGESVMRAPPDGHTILYGTSALVTTMLINRPQADLPSLLIPVSLILSGAIIILINPDLPIQSFADLVAYARANPGRLNIGHPGVATPHHLAAEVLARREGLNLVTVPFNGNAANLTAAVRGDVQVAFDSVQASQPVVASGRLRPIAVTGATRTPGLPDIPAVAESVPDFAVYFWHGVMLPAGTPAGVVARLEAEAVAILAMPDVRVRILAQNAEAGSGGATAMRSRIEDDVARWRPVIRALNLEGS